ncbi:MAG TPA: RNA ligase family protein [Candidatus Binatia bacterium]
MSEPFFRFPRTPHLAWLGSGQPRDDKVLSSEEARELLDGEVVVEEKIDGANLGLSVDAHGRLRAQNRGSYVARERSAPQFKHLFAWLDQRASELVDALAPDLILFGEWCYAVHAIRYTRLPDWFIAFDVYDRARGEFWSVPRRDALIERLGLALVPRIASGRFDLEGLRRLLGPSRFTDGPAEGIYVRRDEGDHLRARAKLVRPEFTAAIGEHWSRRTLERNRLAVEAPSAPPRTR